VTPCHAFMLSMRVADVDIDDVRCMLILRMLVAHHPPHDDGDGGGHLSDGVLGILFELYQ
jgi:hypothetical protein